MGNGGTTSSPRSSHAPTSGGTVKRSKRSGVKFLAVLAYSPEKGEIGIHLTKRTLGCAAFQVSTDNHSNRTSVRMRTEGEQGSTKETVYVSSRGEQDTIAMIHTAREEAGLEFDSRSVAVETSNRSVEARMTFDNSQGQNPSNPESLAPSTQTADVYPVIEYV